MIRELGMIPAYLGGIFGAIGVWVLILPTLLAIGNLLGIGFTVAAIVLPMLAVVGVYVCAQVWLAICETIVGGRAA